MQTSKQNVISSKGLPKGTSPSNDSDEKKTTSKVKLAPLVLRKRIKDHCHALSALSIKGEIKETVPLFKGSGAPSILRDAGLGFEFISTKESSLLRETLGKFFSDRDYTFRLATALNMSSSGTGAVNSVVTNAGLASNSEFASLSTLFNECFVSTLQVSWEPVSLYNYPLTGAPATNVASLPLGVAGLQGAQVAYTSLGAMADSGVVSYQNTGRKFHYAWHNVNKRSIADNAPYSIGTVTQAWCSCPNIANYLGQIQFLSQSAPPALPVSQVLGTFLVEWIVSFRVRF